MDISSVFHQVQLLNFSFLHLPRSTVETKREETRKKDKKKKEEIEALLRPKGKDTRKKDKKRKKRCEYPFIV